MRGGLAVASLVAAAALATGFASTRSAAGDRVRGRVSPTSSRRSRRRPGSSSRARTSLRSRSPAVRPPTSSRPRAPSTRRASSATASSRSRARSRRTRSSSPCRARTRRRSARLRPAEAAEAEARRRGPAGADRSLHPRGAEAARPAPRAAQGGQPGAGREGDRRQARARRGGRGFVYATDVRAASSRLLAIPLPKRSQPTVRYEVAVVKGSKNRAAALEPSPTCSAPTAGASPQCRLGSREKPVRRRARARDGTHALLPAPPDPGDLRRHPARRAARRDERPAAVDALLVTLKTTLIANAVILLVGTPAPYLIATTVPARNRCSSPRSNCPSCCRPRWRGSACSRPRPLRPARRDARRPRPLDPVHAARRRPRGHVRGQLLHPRRDLGVRVRRPGADRRRPDARRRPGAHVLPRRTAARVRRARCRLGALLRARDRRVRRHDHVRRLASGRDANLRSPSTSSSTSPSTSRSRSAPSS